MSIDRNKICRDLGLTDVTQAHELIVKRNITMMIRYKLKSAVLERLGYTLKSMRQFGYSDPQLAQLGFRLREDPPIHAMGHPDAEVRDTTPATSAVADSPVFRMLRAGYHKLEFHKEGYNIHHLKKSGLEARDCYRIGFEMDEIVQAYTPMELRRAGFGVRELRGSLRPDELRAAGFTAMDMRLGGFSIRELMAAGFHENHIKVAGYSNAELMREGLSRTTIDNRGY